MPNTQPSLQEQLDQAKLVIAELQQDKERLTLELTRLRGRLQSGRLDTMSTKLKEALRE
ncbi:hypothetical protein Back11_35540 [Paenibacillus baekrokdamisoli]|uniref:Uncharacterized protein n=1 Tax=Paenibacillus baekrokdamisoli TaxID=1712516 RepID=A0A3G9JGT5_9BACL|nr:hypothetical protein [Paenibacillus baekrokdamisoli]MBB3070853.1 regulator of replication initiation timing [Paenibacillus baekrokdamisoli]BBH22209.1 hypothetical protein Back11_35540 [Paenibacillus baekrokdamisoli]